jgi:hypothetical protein
MHPKPGKFHTSPLKFSPSSLLNSPIVLKSPDFLFQELEVIRNGRHGIKWGYSTTHVWLSDRTHYAYEEAGEGITSPVKSVKFKNSNIMKPSAIKIVACSQLLGSDHETSNGTTSAAREHILNKHVYTTVTV